jgi:hypothetical protein
MSKYHNCSFRSNRNPGPTLLCEQVESGSMTLYIEDNDYNRSIPVNFCPYCGHENEPYCEYEKEQRMKNKSNSQKDLEKL